jgi:hypothetical protein
MNKLQELLFKFSFGKVHLFNNDEKEKNFHYIDITDVTPEYLYEFASIHHVAGKEHQTKVYLDKCVAIFSPTCPTMQDLKQWERWQTFFRVSRQIGYDVIIIPQSSKLISRKVIECCEVEVRHFNQKHHGTLGFFLSLFLGGLFTAYTYWRGDKSHPQEQKWYRYRRLYGAMYNSYCLFDQTLQKYKEQYQWKQMLSEEEQEQKAKVQKICKLVNILSLRQQILLELEHSDKYKLGGEKLDTQNNKAVGVLDNSA